MSILPWLMINQSIVPFWRWFRRCGPFRIIRNRPILPRKTNIIKEVPFGKLKDKKLTIHKTNRKGELRYRIPMSKEF